MNKVTTIFALATAAGSAGVAVFRVSGPEVKRTLLALTGYKDLPKPRFLSLSILKDIQGDMLDEAMVVWFPAPHSFTGEDVMELHTHGGRAVTTAVVKALVALGLVPAAPGEFSKRAFFNEKMDLTKAEAIADLVEAKTTAQRKQALRQMGGELEQRIESWRADLLEILALSEATIDFSDEDIPSLKNEITEKHLQLQKKMEHALEKAKRGESIRLGIMVSILGTPNVGKSSLLNHISGRDVAIVSSRAGTTRDIIEIQMDLEGWPVVLCDTAGLRDGGDLVEKEGIHRAYQRAELSDINILVFDSNELNNFSLTRDLMDDRTILVVSKKDLQEEALVKTWCGKKIYSLSAKTGEGVGELLNHLKEKVSENYSPTEEIGFSRERHRLLIEETLESLERFKKAFTTEIGAELAAEELYIAARTLGQLTGRVNVEEVLDIIFGSFCIGK